MMGGINYYSGQVFDMKTITQKAQFIGAKVGFDLAHCVENITLNLHDWNVDFTVWCSYKYLNSGMGGVSGIFLDKNHHQSDLQRFAGWWGYDEATRFKMQKKFRAHARGRWLATQYAHDFVNGVSSCCLRDYE